MNSFVSCERSKPLKESRRYDIENFRIIIRFGVSVGNHSRVWE